MNTCIRLSLISFWDNSFTFSMFQYLMYCNTYINAKGFTLNLDSVDNFNDINFNYI